MFDIDEVSSGVTVFQQSKFHCSCGDSKTLIKVTKVKDASLVRRVGCTM